MNVALLTETNNPEPFLSDPEYCVEEKLNGKRMLLEKRGNVVRAFNRKGEEIVAPLAVVQKAMGSCGSWVIDGELIGEKFVSFDILSINQESVTHLPNYSRRLKLQNYSPFHYVRRQHGPKRKRALFEDTQKYGGEGVVFKRMEDAYPESRSYGVKYKFYRTETFIVADRCLQRCSIGLQRDGMERGRVAFNFNDQWPKVGELVEVRFDEISRHGKLMRPILLGIRDDVTAADLLSLT